MGNTHQLQGKLKALKLGGMLDTLELRLGQAQQAHLGYVEFLEFLMEDELQRRANRRLVTRVARARFEEEKTFEGFDFTFNPKIPAEDTGPADQGPVHLPVHPAQGVGALHRPSRRG